MILAGLLTVNAAASITCNEPVARTFTQRSVPLGDQAAGGRLATLALIDIGGAPGKELVGAVVPPLSAPRPMGLWSAELPPDGPARADVHPMQGLSAAGLQVLAGDLDGDGRGDIVLADPARDELLNVVWLPDGVALSPRHPAELGPQPIVADLGADGVDELLSVSPTGAIAVWSLTDDVPRALVQRSLPEAVAQAVGDLDGDGAPEWIIARGSTRQLSVAWRGDLNALEHIRIPVADARAVLAVDLDVDGNAEVLLLDRRRGSVRRLDGDSLRRGPWIVTLKQRASRNGPQSLHVGDLDGDGCLDVVLHSLTTHEMAIGWGGNRGRFYPQHLAPGPGPVAVGDLDGVAGEEIAVVTDGEVVVLSVRR